MHDIMRICYANYAHKHPRVIQLHYRQADLHIASLSESKQQQQQLPHADCG